MLKNRCPPIHSNAAYTRRLSENGYFPQFLRQTQIIILEILQCIPACPVGLADRTRVVIIFAFPRSKSGIFDLILEKISHSQTPYLACLCADRHRQVEFHLTLTFFLGQGDVRARQYRMSPLSAISSFLAPKCSP